MISKGELFRLVRIKAGYTQEQMKTKMKLERRNTISEYELGKEPITYARLCQVCIIYTKLCVPDETIDEAFNYYIDKMLNE